MRIAVVTDSTADIPNHIALKKSIRVIPAILVIDGKSLVDGEGITRSQFYDLLPEIKTPPTTATPSIARFQAVYDQLFQEGYENILSIHVASQLSGMVSTAQIASKEFNGKVTVIDSGQLSLGLGFQVLAASEFVADGCEMDQLLLNLQDIRQRIRVIAMLDTLEYVRRSGRVSWARARIGSMLKIKPFVEVKGGKVLNRGQTRTRKKGIEHLISMCQKFGTIEKFAILHTNAESEANLLLAKLDESWTEPPMIVNVTTIVGAHVGPNGLGFAIILNNNPNFHQQI